MQMKNPSEPLLKQLERESLGVKTKSLFLPRGELWLRSFYKQWLSYNILFLLLRGEISHLPSWGVAKDWHQLLLSYPAVGYGVVNYNGIECWVCCLQPVEI